MDYVILEELANNDATTNNTASIVGAYIQMDDQVKTVNRQVTTLIDALKSTGGVMSVVFFLALMLIQYFQKIIYYTSLVKSLYCYQLKQP